MSTTDDRPTTDALETGAELPPLTAREFRLYNHMAEHMDAFHSHFRQTWTLLLEAFRSSALPPRISASAFRRAGLDFCRQLTLHHTIEEQHIFPVLATRMESFRRKGEMITAHEAIHAGVERMQGFFEAMGREVEWEEGREVMESFGDVLWRHLDEEVELLGAGNMRRYWSLEEMARMPM